MSEYEFSATVTNIPSESLVKFNSLNDMIIFKKDGMSTKTSTMDWGDGTIQNVDFSNYSSYPTHYYSGSLESEYTITFEDPIIEMNSFFTHNSKYYLKSLTIPNNCNFAAGVFYNYPNLESVLLSDGIKSLTTAMFSTCPKLTNIDLPNSIQSIESACFSACHKLRNVKLPNNLLKIEPQAFAACQSLTNVILPESLQDIGAYAFANCSSLTEIEIPSSVIFSGGDIFTDCINLGLYKLNWKSNPQEYSKLGAIDDAFFLIPKNTTQEYIDAGYPEDSIIERMVTPYLKKDNNQIPLARKDYVEERLKMKANKKEIPTKVSQLKNDMGYLRSHQNISGKVDKSELDDLVVTIEYLDNTTETITLIKRRE